MKKLLGVYYVFLFCLLFVSQDAKQLQLPPREQLQMLQFQAESKLAALEQSISSLQNIANNQETSLSDSRAALASLETLYRQSLESLSDYATKLTILQDSYDRQQKILNRWRLALILWTLLKVVRMVLGFIPQTRGINKIIPWWLDVII